jgi:cell division protein FtsB
MRVNRIMIVLSLVLIGGSFASVLAQASAQERATSLRSQMAELELKQSELQARLDQLNNDMKPENIERAFAGIGSVHPEELREHRRRQLEIEKNYVVAQLNELAASRTRLEAAIAQADNEAYRRLVGPNATDQSAISPAPAKSKASTSGARRRARHARRQRTARP